MESWENPGRQREYYNPASLAEHVGPNAVEWFLSRCCVTPTGPRVRTLAKCVVLCVAFFAAVAQWSALASGVALFSKRVGFDADAAAGVTSAALSVCFLSCIVGGALSDGTWGCNRVLLFGLSFGVGAAAVGSALCFQTQLFSELWARVILSVSIFVFAASLGFVQTSLSTLIGDQCHENPRQLASVYNIYYGAVQLGAFVARFGFPLVDDRVNWFVGMVGFVAFPVIVGLFVAATHTAVLTTKVPVDYSPVALTMRIISRRVCGTPYDELVCYYPEKVVRDSLRVVKVLRLHVTLPIFWALYFQMFGLWYIQTTELDLTLWGDYEIVAEQATVMNPLFDVICLALFSGMFHGLRVCCKVRILPQWKMQVGFLFAILAFACATFLQYKIETVGKNKISVIWQMPQFVLICAAEVLVYPPALHLAYVNSPAAMRSFIQSTLWFFIGVGNLLNTIIIVAAKKAIDDGDKMPIYLAYAGLMLLTCLTFGVLSHFYDEHPADAEDKRFAVNGSFRGGNGSTRPQQQVAAQQTQPQSHTTPRQQEGATPGSAAAGYATPPFRSGVSDVGTTDDVSPPRFYSSTQSHYSNQTGSGGRAGAGAGEDQPLLETPDRRYRGATPSTLSANNTPHQPRRVPTPRDPRRGGVTYYSTRKSPRTSTLE